MRCFREIQRSTVSNAALKSNNTKRQLISRSFSSLIPFCLKKQSTVQHRSFLIYWSHFSRKGSMVDMSSYLWYCCHPTSFNSSLAVLLWPLLLKKACSPRELPLTGHFLFSGSFSVNPRNGKSQHTRRFWNISLSFFPILVFSFNFSGLPWACLRASCCHMIGRLLTSNKNRCT